MIVCHRLGREWGETDKCTDHGPELTSPPDEKKYRRKKEAEILALY